jgi:hypothetical protein
MHTTRHKHTSAILLFCTLLVGYCLPFFLGTLTLNCEQQQVGFSHTLPGQLKNSKSACRLGFNFEISLYTALQLSPKKHQKPSPKLKKSAPVYIAGKPQQRKQQETWSL